MAWYNYDAILAELRTSKDAYQAFFARLAGGVQRAVQSKSALMRRLEEERLVDVQAARTQQDETLLRLAEEEPRRRRLAPGEDGLVALCLLPFYSLPVFAERPL